MGIFGFGKKKIELSAPTTGLFQQMENINDPVFSQKMMGEGFGIIPEEGKVYAPVSGVISSVFETKHAIGIKTEDGIEVLIHMGLDTVELDGKPFQIVVSEGNDIKKGAELAIMDLDMIKRENKETTVVVVVTNSVDKVKSMRFLSDKKNELLSHGEDAIEFVLK